MSVSKIQKLVSVLEIIGIFENEISTTTFNNKNNEIISISFDREEKKENLKNLDEPIIKTFMMSVDFKIKKLGKYYLIVKEYERNKGVAEAVKFSEGVPKYELEIEHNEFAILTNYFKRTKFKTGTLLTKDKFIKDMKFYF